MTSHDNQLRDIFSRLPREGQSPSDFGELGRLASVFHLDFSLWDELVKDDENVRIFDELETTVFPFDVFEIAFSDTPNMSFRDSGAVGHQYRPLRYLLAVRYEADQVIFTILDDLEMRYSANGIHIKRMISACQYTLIPAPSKADNAKILFTPILPYGVRGSAQDKEKIAFEEQCHTYWLSILIAIIRFTHLLNHRGVMIKRFADPLRPSTRQQRRAAGYVDRDHHRIVLRPRLSVNQAIHDALSGRSTRYTPRRRHPVQEFIRTYASGKIGPVRAHVRGGRLAPGVDYDARAVIRAAITSE